MSSDKLQKSDQLKEFIRENYFAAQKQHTLTKFSYGIKRENTLRLILNHYLDSNDYSLEYLLVEEWIRRFREAKKDFFVTSQKQHYSDLKEALGLWLFFLKKKIITIKDEPKKQITARPQTKIWLINIIFSLVLAINIGRFAPALAQAITTPIDKITSYPIIKIGQFINNKSVVKRIKKHEQAIDQKKLITFIKKYHKNFQLGNQVNQTYIITAKELFGQMAGAQEKVKSNTISSQFSRQKLLVEKENGRTGSYFKWLIKKIGEEQIRLSEKLNKKLQKYFK